MKKTQLTMLMLVFLVFAFGCKKDDTETVTPGLSVKIDGTTWTGKVNTGYYDAQNNLTVIAASNTSLTEQLQLAFIGNSTGTYTFSANDFESFGAFAYMSTVDIYTTISDITPVGQIVITEYDKTNHTISGTFHFEGYNSLDEKKTFTEGKFTKISYEEQK